MTDQPLAAWPKWRDDLVFRLRLKNVSGDAIGDILYEIDSHLRESGETPEQAFGTSKEYAQTRVVNQQSATRQRGDLLPTIFIPCVAGVGGFLLATGAWDLGAASDAWFGLPPWTVLAGGAAILAFVFLRLPDDLVTDPRTNTPIMGSARQGIAVIAGSFVVMAIIAFALGWFLAR